MAVVSVERRVLTGLSSQVLRQHGRGQRRTSSLDWSQLTSADDVQLHLLRQHGRGQRRTSSLDWSQLTSADDIQLHSHTSSNQLRRHSPVISAASLLPLSPHLAPRSKPTSYAKPPPPGQNFLGSPVACGEGGGLEGGLSPSTKGLSPHRSPRYDEFISRHLV